MRAPERFVLSLSVFLVFVVVVVVECSFLCLFFRALVHFDIYVYSFPSPPLLSPNRLPRVGCLVMKAAARAEGRQWAFYFTFSYSSHVFLCLF